MPTRRSRCPYISTCRATSFRLSSIASRNFIDLEVTEVWRIPYVNPGAQFVEEKAELMPRIEAVLASGMHVGGPEIEALERETAAYVGTRHAVALNSGTDALIFAMVAAGIGPGDEVITPPNSFVASTAAIVRAGATPVFADVGWDGLLDPDAVAAAVTPRTAAIMPVHLWGGVCDMDALWAIAELYRSLLARVPIRLPAEKPYELHTFVNFVSQCDRRDELQKHLAAKGVQTVVHYNTPIHLQPAAKALGCPRGQFPVTERLCETILALPANQTLSQDDVAFVSSEIRAFLGAAKSSSASDEPFQEGAAAAS